MNAYNLNQDQLEQMTKQASQQAEELNQLGKNGFEAWLKTANLWMDGTQNLWKSYTDMANQTRESQAQAAKQFMSCKTLNDMTETSAKVAQDLSEQMMSNATSLSEQTVKVCMETLEPLNDSMTKGFQTAKKTSKKAA